jgi:hypothetical protein
VGGHYSVVKRSKGCDRVDATCMKTFSDVDTLHVLCGSYLYRYR